MIMEENDSPAETLVPAVYMTAIYFVTRPVSIVYIDGFNLYYGAVKNTPHKWLNLDRLFTLLRPNDEIKAIRYFTALVTGPSRVNQETYLRALASTAKVEVSLVPLHSDPARSRQEKQS